MRGDQLARQWRIVRVIEASLNGLTVTGIAQREETGIRTVYSNLEAFQTAGFPMYTERVDRANRWPFIGLFKFKIPPLFTLIFTLTGLMSLYFYKELIRVLKGTPFYNSLETVFKKGQSIETNLWEMAGGLCSHIPTVENKGVRKNLIFLRDISGDLQSNFTCVFNGGTWRELGHGK